MRYKEEERMGDGKSDVPILYISFQRTIFGSERSLHQRSGSLSLRVNCTSGFLERPFESAVFQNLIPITEDWKL